MGTDNIHHKRKAKKLGDLSRSRAKRKPYDKILIVCEGEKTEVNYFNEIVIKYKLSSANVMITGDCGSAPINVVKYALKLAKKDEKIGTPYDVIYCVIDKDDHESYKEAIETAQNCNLKHKLNVINSVPSFEFWLLLHFKLSTKAYSSQENNSCGKQVLAELKRELPAYEKGSKDVFNQLERHLDIALKNAKIINAQAKENNTDMPSTKVNVLVEKMIKLKKSIVS